MEKKIFEALKRVIPYLQKHKEGYGEPKQIELDIVQVETWIDEVAREYDEVECKWNNCGRITDNGCMVCDTCQQLPDYDGTDYSNACGLEKGDTLPIKCKNCMVRVGDNCQCN